MKRSYRYIISVMELEIFLNAREARHKNLIFAHKWTIVIPPQVLHLSDTTIWGHLQATDDIVQKRICSSNKCPISTLTDDFTT